MKFEGMSETRSHVPVDVPDVVAELIFPDFREFHSSSLEDGVVLAGKDLVDQSLSANLYLPDLL